MTLDETFQANTKSIPRHAATYAAALSRHACLATYPTLPPLAEMLLASSLDNEARLAIVLALVDEQQRAKHPLWGSLLLLAFEPMLRRLRFRLRRPNDKALDQEVILAFLEAAAIVTTTDRPHVIALRLKSKTERRVFDMLRRVQRGPHMEDFDDDTWAEHTLADVLTTRGADRIVELLDGAKNAPMKALLFATCVEEESLGSYVERVYPDLSGKEAASMVAKLRKQRKREIERLAVNEGGRSKLVEEEVV